MRGLALALMGTLLLAVACDRGPAASSGRAGARKAPPPDASAVAEETQAAPQVQTAAVAFTYDSTGKRDPFRSFVLEHAREVSEVERGPLEQFDLSQLSVVAVVWGNPRPRALVTDPSGRGYVVQEGTPIGKNDGRVIRIRDNEVLVREIYEDYLGDRTSKEIEMRVRQSQGG